jgi:hypothetical protein
MKVFKVGNEYNRNHRADNLSISFGSAQKSIQSLLSDIDNIHLNDKIAATIKRLEHGDFLVVSPNMENSINDVKKLTTLFTDALTSVYHIANNKFNEVLVFAKLKPGKTDFININYEPIRVNTYDIKPFYGQPIKNGDRIWGKTLRSVLIKDKPEIPKELESYSILFANQYNPDEINSLSKMVLQKPPHTLRS